MKMYMHAWFILSIKIDQFSEISHPALDDLLLKGYALHTWKVINIFCIKNFKVLLHFLLGVRINLTRDEI